MTGLRRRLEGEIEIRVTGGDAFHDVIVNKPHHFSNVHPKLVQGCDLHEGAFGKPGSKICWKYTIDGKALTAKQIVEVIDHKNKVMKFNVIEGDILKDYKSFVVTYQVIPKDEKTSILKWILEYEKLHLGIPEPTATLDALLELAKEMDEYQHHQAK